MSKNPETVWISFLDDVDTKDALYLGDDIAFTIDGISEDIPGILSIDSQTDIHPQWSKGFWDIQWKTKDVIVSFDEMYKYVKEIEWCPWYYGASCQWREGVLHVVDGKTEVHLWFEYAWINPPNEFWIQVAMKNMKLVFLQNIDGVPLEVEGLQYDDRLRNLWNNAFLYEDKKWYAIVQCSENWVEEIFRAVEIKIIESNNVTAALGSKSSLILFAYNESWKMAIITHSEKGVRQLSDFEYNYIWDPDDAMVMPFEKPWKLWKEKWFLSIYSDGIHETNPGLVASSSRVHNNSEILYKVGLMMIVSKTKREILEDGQYHNVIPFSESKKES